VDSVIQSLPFSKEGLSIQDTGAMYVVNTPAGISIKWAHITGIIDIQYGLYSNTSMKTEGICGEAIAAIFSLLNNFPFKIYTSLLCLQSAVPIALLVTPINYTDNPI